jgi:hypothetical protein
MMLRRLANAASAIFALSSSQQVAAAPPPMPPAYVSEVSTLLSRAMTAPVAEQLGAYLADDVHAYDNGALVARGRSSWLERMERTPTGSDHVIGKSEGWDAQGGSLMIVDQYDSVDRSHLPKTFLADPRFAIRATLYQFGQDHRIHVIRSIHGAGFWKVP